MRRGDACVARTPGETDEPGAGDVARDVGATPASPADGRDAARCDDGPVGATPASPVPCADGADPSRRARQASPLRAARVASRRRHRATQASSLRGTRAASRCRRRATQASPLHGSRVASRRRRRATQASPLRGLLAEAMRVRWARRLRAGPPPGLRRRERRIDRRSVVVRRHPPVRLPAPAGTPRPSGRSDALMTVVLARSYSRNSGRTSLLRLTVRPAVRQRSPISCSWAGLTKLNSRQTATWRRPRRGSPATSRSTSAGSSGSTTSPPAPMRSRTVNQFSSGVSGAGAVDVQGVEARPVLAADQEHVAEALGGDERDRLAGPLEQGVGGDGRAVDDPAGRARGRTRRTASITAR